jgi:hypothetical protein
VEILRPDRIRLSAGRTRLFAAPQYAKVGDVWRPLADALTVAHDGATAAYRVSLGEAFVEFRPRLRKGALDEARIAPGRFGHVLDTEAAEVDDFIQYDVTASGATATAAGWAFSGDYGGGGKSLTLGLFMEDWIARFGAEKVNKTASAVELDLRGWKAARDALSPAQRAAVGMHRLDLDPTVAAETGENSLSSAGGTWAEARAGTGWAVTVWHNLQVKAHASDVYAEIYRGSLRFDTSSLDEAPADATLRVYLSDETGPMGKIRADVIADYGTLEAADWPQTSLANCGTVDTAGMSINDVLTYAVAPGEIDLGGYTAFRLREADHDAADTEPDGTVCNNYFYDAGDATYPPVLDVLFGGTRRDLTLNGLGS